ncbi:MAG: HAD-IA family hydrolase, partial [Candidatus Omnitrophota bacterium]
ASGNRKIAHRLAKALGVDYIILGHISRSKEVATELGEKGRPVGLAEGVVWMIDGSFAKKSGETGDLAAEETGGFLLLRAQKSSDVKPIIPGRLVTVKEILQNPGYAFTSEKSAITKLLRLKDLIYYKDAILEWSLLSEAALLVQDLLGVLDIKAPGEYDALSFGKENWQEFYSKIPAEQKVKLALQIRQRLESLEQRVSPAPETQYVTVGKPIRELIKQKSSDVRMEALSVVKPHRFILPVLIEGRLSLRQAVLREITPELTDELNQTTFLDVLKKPTQPDNRLYASSPLYTGLENLRFEVSTLRITRSKAIGIFGQEDKTWKELFEYFEADTLLLKPNFREILAGLNVSADKKQKLLDALKIQTDLPGPLAALSDYQEAIRQQESIFRRRLEDFLLQSRQKYSSNNPHNRFGSSPLIQVKNKAIITDLGGVVVRNDQALMLQEFSAVSGKSSEEIAELLPDSIARALSAVGAITDDEFIARLQRELGIGGMDKDTFLRLYNSGYTADRETVAILNILKLLGYKVAILSDIGTIHYAYMLNFLPINQLNLSWLDGFFASCDLEMTKPNLPVYEHVLHNLGVAAGDAIFIDDREVNVAAAESLGITSIHFTGAEKLKQELIKLGVLGEAFLEETSENITENVAISIRSLKHSSASDVFDPLSGLNMHIQMASDAEGTPQAITEIGLKVKEISDALHALHNAAKAVTCERIVSRGEINLLRDIFAASIGSVLETLAQLRVAVATQKDIDSVSHEVSTTFRNLNAAYQYMRELPHVLKNRFARFNGEPKLKRINIDELVAIIGQAYRHWRSDNHWQVYVVGKPHTLLIMVDVIALENSISNAIKNSLEAGAQKIEIFVGSEAGRVFIIISDDGHGIESKNLKATPSGRPLVCALNASTKDNSGEIRGLGLSEAYNAVEGRITINSLTQNELDGLNMSTEVMRLEASESLCKQVLISLRLRQYLARLFEKFSGIEHMISGIVANRDSLLSESKRSRLFAEMLIFGRTLDYLDREVIGFFIADPDIFDGIVKKFVTSGIGQIMREVKNLEVALDLADNLFPVQEFAKHKVAAFRTVDRYVGMQAFLERLSHGERVKVGTDITLYFPITGIVQLSTSTKNGTNGGSASSPLSDDDVLEFLKEKEEADEVLDTARENFLSTLRIASEAKLDDPRISVGGFLGDTLFEFKRKIKAEEGSPTAKILNLIEEIYAGKKIIITKKSSKLINHFAVVSIRVISWRDKGNEFYKQGAFAVPGEQNVKIMYVDSVPEKDHVAVVLYIPEKIWRGNIEGHPQALFIAVNNEILSAVSDLKFDAKRLVEERLKTGSSPLKNPDIQEIKAAEERSLLVKTIQNIFKDGEALDLTVQEINEAVRIDTTFDAYRLYRGLPIVLAFDGEIFRNCPLDKKPLLMVFVGRGVVSDKALILDARSSQGLALEGSRLSNSMEIKNALWEIAYHGKKTTFALQDKDNWVGMPVLNGPSDIYELGRLMGKGGNRITRLGAEIAKPEGIVDEDRIFEEYTRAMVIARLLGFSILDGPDMMRDVDRRMGIMVRVARETVRDINEFVKTHPNYPPIDEKEVLKATTSNPEEEGGFSHTAWMVTSRGVMQGTISALRWLRHVSIQREGMHPEAVVEFVNGLNIDFSNISGLIQGFGDVGSGLAKLLYTLFRNFNITTRGISNRYFALYREGGLSTAFLKEAREIAEINPDALNIDRLLGMINMNEELKGATIWVANFPDRKTGLPIYSEARVQEITAALVLRGIQVVSGGAAIIDELIYQKATILFPAAGPNLIKELSQIERLKVAIVAEGANNAIKVGLQPELRKHKILYLPGELLNGGGIYTSKEDIRHNHTDGLAAIVHNPGYYQTHVTDEIDTLVLHRVTSLLELWAETQASFAIDFAEHMRTIAREIFKRADALVREENPSLMEYARIDQERTSDPEAGLPRLPVRHSLYEIAIEMAPEGILYRPKDVSKYLEEFERTPFTVRENGRFDNYEICELRFRLFTLMKMSYFLNETQRARLINALFAIVPNANLDNIVRKEAFVCLAMALRWKEKSKPSDVGQAEKLFHDILSDPNEPNRLNVWAQYCLYRILGQGYLEAVRNGVLIPNISGKDWVSSPVNWSWVNGECLLFENRHGLLIPGEVGIGKSTLAISIARSDERWKVVSCGSTNIGIAYAALRPVLLAKTIGGGNIIYSRLLGKVPMAMSQKKIIKVDTVLALDDLGRDILTRFSGADLSFDRLGIAFVDVSNMDAGREAGEIIKLLNILIEARAFPPKVSSSPLDLPLAALARSYRIWRGFEAAGDISAKKQRKLGMEKIKIEHTEPLLAWARVQFTQLGILIPIASAKFNPAIGYGNLALDYVTFVPGSKLISFATDFVFVLKGPTVDLLVANHRSRKPVEDIELGLIADDSLDPYAFSMLIGELLKGASLNEIISRHKNISSPAEERIPFYGANIKIVPAPSGTVKERILDAGFAMVAPILNALNLRAEIAPAVAFADIMRSRGGYFDTRREKYILPWYPLGAKERTPVLIVTDADILDTDSYGRIIYEQLFGYAYPRINTAITSMYMLGADFARNAKNGIHEIGHLLGLEHCLNYYCVMHLSHSVDELDATKNTLCPNCAVILESLRQASSSVGADDVIFPSAQRFLLGTVFALKQNIAELTLTLDKPIVQKTYRVDRQYFWDELFVRLQENISIPEISANQERVISGLHARIIANVFRTAFYDLLYGLAKEEGAVSVFNRFRNIVFEEDDSVVFPTEIIYYPNLIILHSPKRVSGKIHRVTGGVGLESLRKDALARPVSLGYQQDQTFFALWWGQTYAYLPSLLTREADFLKHHLAMEEGHSGRQLFIDIPLPSEGGSLSSPLSHIVSFKARQASEAYSYNNKFLRQERGGYLSVAGGASSPAASDFLKSNLIGASSPAQLVAIGVNIHRSVHLQHQNQRAVNLIDELYAYLRSERLLEKEIVLPENIMVSRISAFIENQLKEFDKKRLRLIGDGGYLQKCFEQYLLGQFSFVARNPSTVLETHLPLDVIYYPGHNGGDSSIEDKKAFVVSAVKSALWQRLPYEVYFDSGFVARGHERRRVLPVTVEMWSNVQKLIAGLDRRKSSSAVNSNLFLENTPFFINKNGISLSVFIGLRQSEVNKEVRYLVAESNSLVVGDLEYDSGRLGYRDGLLVEDIYVEDEWRGLGIGHHLMAGVIAEIRRMGREKIVVPYTRLDTLAERFYRRVGSDFSMVMEILPFGLFFNKIIYVVTEDTVAAVENFTRSGLVAQNVSQGMSVSSSPVIGGNLSTAQERVRRYIDNLYHEFYLRLNDGVREENGQVIVDASRTVLYGRFQHTPAEILELVSSFAGLNNASNVYVIGGDGKTAYLLATYAGSVTSMEVDRYVFNIGYAVTTWIKRHIGDNFGGLVSKEDVEYMRNLLDRTRLISGDVFHKFVDLSGYDA